MYEVRCYPMDTPTTLEKATKVNELWLAKCVAYDHWAIDQLDVVLVDLDTQEVVLTLDEEDRQ